MAQVNINELLKKANNYLKDPDTIIDPFDMSFVWISERSRELSGNNLVNKHIDSKSRSLEGKNEDFGQMNEDTAVVDYKVKEKKIVIQTKSNEEKVARINYVVIEFAGQPYLVTKLIQIED